MNQVIYRLPVDHPVPLDRPLFVVNLDGYSRLSPSITDNQVRDAVLQQLEPCVAPADSQSAEEPTEGQRGYVVIVLCATDQATARQVGIRWVLAQLAKVERRYRKGLKRLYLVHASAYTSTFLPLLTAFVSPKFLNKIHAVPSIATLVRKHHLSLSGLKLSLAQLQAEAAALAEPKPTGGWTSWATAPIRAVADWIPVWPTGSAADDSDTDQAGVEQEKGWWGRNAEELCQLGVPERAESTGSSQPGVQQLKDTIVRDCVQTEGVFRKTPHAPIRPAIIHLLELPLSQQPVLPWEGIAQLDPALPPKCLLRLFSSMSEPLIPSALYPAIRQTTDRASIISGFLPLLPRANRELFLDLIGTLHLVLQHEKTTRMSARNLAIVTAPDLIRGPNPVEDLSMCLERGKALPSSLATPGVSTEDKGEGGGDNTCVGMLEIMIREYDGDEGSLR